MTWQRPKNLAFPTVWLRFEGKKPLKDGKLPKFKVQDVTDEMRDDVMAVMLEEFLRDEPTCKSSNFKDCLETRQLVIQLWKKCFEEKCALVCLLDEDTKLGQKPTIVGANMTTIARRCDPKDDLQVKPKAWRDVIGALQLVADTVDVFERYGVEEYLAAYGLLVRPAFRGQNIGAEILRARIPLCKAIGIQVTANVFSAGASQTLAERVGFECVGEISYHSLLKEHGIDFPDINEKSSKMMVLKIKH